METVSPITLAELRRERDLLLRQRKLREAYGINFYRPHWKQHKFHITDAVSRYARTGNRFGKSELGIHEDVAWCMGGRVWYREAFDIMGTEKVIHPDGTWEYVPVVKEHHPGGLSHPYVTRGIPGRPVKGLLIVVDWDMAKRIFTNNEGSWETKGKLFKAIPREAIGKCTLSRGGHMEKVEIKRPNEFGGGSSTLSIDTIESYKHNKLGAESADWDFIHIDEPCPEKLYKAHARGLMDRDGRDWFTCTPLDEMWINDKFTPPGRKTVDEVAEVEFEGKLESGQKTGKMFIITGAIHDNPHMNAAGVARYEAGLTREEKQCRLFGLPLAMAGMVYKEFIYDMHVLADVPTGWKAYHLPPLDYTIRVAWDVHGARIPQAILFAATAPTGDVFIYDELFCEPLITPCAKLVKKKLEHRFVVSQIIDPRALIKNPVTNSADVIEAIQEEDLYFEAASKDLTTGISKVKEKLEERHVVTKLPTIYFAPHLTQTMYEFSHYIYDLEKNEPKDQDNHMMENLYRLILNGLDYIEPPSDADYARRSKLSIGFGEDLNRGRIDYSNSSLRV
jgi:hypothetical protein